MQPLARGGNRPVSDSWIPTSKGRLQRPNSPRLIVTMIVEAATLWPSTMLQSSNRVLDVKEAANPFTRRDCRSRTRRQGGAEPLELKRPPAVSPRSRSGRRQKPAGLRAATGHGSSAQAHRGRWVDSVAATESTAIHHLRKQGGGRTSLVIRSRSG